MNSIALYDFHSYSGLQPAALIFMIARRNKAKTESSLHCSSYEEQCVVRIPDTRSVAILVQEIFQI